MPHRPQKQHPSHLSRDPIFNNLNNDAFSESEEPFDHTKLFSINSAVNLTWGVPVSTPVEAVQRHRRTAKPRRRSSNNNTSEPSSDLPNGPDRSPFFRISLEAREVIYGYLLVHTVPILVHSDWQSVQTNPPHSHAILKTCKQIREEGSRFSYRHNVFQAIVHSNRQWETGFLIGKCWLKYLRNVIIHCDRRNWSEDGLTQVSESIAALVDAETYLKSFTIVVEPEVVGFTVTATGLQSRVIAFADFFWAGSKFMKLIPRLQCKTLNIIMKLQGPTRVLVSIDLQHLDQEENQRVALKWRAKGVEQEKLEEQEKRNAQGVGGQDVVVEQTDESLTLQQAEKGDRLVGFLEEDLVARDVRQKLKGRALQPLRGLKRLFEEVFDNHKMAVEVGKCRLLGEHEDLKSTVAS